MGAASPTPASATPSAVAAATRATYAAFIGAGFAFASWASRIPQVKDRLHLSSAQLGLVLLAVAAGSVLSLPLAGVIVGRLSTRRTVTVMSVLFAIALATVATGYLAGVVPVVLGLFLLGFANGAWDVAMNVQGADVERQRGVAIMPRFHAGFSLGTVAGASLGALMIVLKVPVTAHLLGVALVVLVGVPALIRPFLPDPPKVEEPARHPTARRRATLRWREPRTLLIGVLVLAFAFSEGTSNDWISLAVIQGYHAPAVAGTLCFAVFLAAMTAARWFGPGVLDRYGRVTVIRLLAALALAGLLLFIFSPILPLAFLGAVLWGTGTSLGFPVGMSAAADQPHAAAERVSVVASIGYCAFLAGPPLIGFLSSHSGILHALASVAVLLAIAVVLAPTLRIPVTDLPDVS